jgi:hypothetical protein
MCAPSRSCTQLRMPAVVSGQQGQKKARFEDMPSDAAHRGNIASVLKQTPCEHLSTQDTVWCVCRLPIPV